MLNVILKSIFYTILLLVTAGLITFACATLILFLANTFGVPVAAGFVVFLIVFAGVFVVLDDQRRINEYRYGKKK